MRSFLIIASFVIASLINNAAAQPVLTLTPVISGLSQPIQLVHPGDGSGRIFIVHKTGTILVYDKSYGLIGTFLTVTGISTTGEQGLLSLAFDPDYTSTGLLYVYYDNSAGDLQVARYSVSVGDVNVADPASKDTVITIPHPTNSNHNGGELHFGNDGYLYLSTGDGGGGGDGPNNAQTISVLLGKMLRLAVNASPDPPFYSIPHDNPFGNEVYAYGLRNPFRWSFDRLTYDTWIGDVGQDSWEEINYRPKDSSKGVNYGWRCYEGNATYNTSVGCTGPLTDYNFPVHTYATPNPSGAITGGTVYRGNTYIKMRGYYIGTDYYTGVFYKVKYDVATHSATTATQTLVPLINNIADFGETENGELYAVSLGGGIVYRISSDGPIGYTFTGNGNWDVAANWTDNAIPPASLPAGAEIIVDPVLNGEAVLNVPQTVLAGAKLTVQPNKKFRINGNLTIE